MKITIETSNELDSEQLARVLQIAAEALLNDEINEDTELMDGSHRLDSPFGNVFVSFGEE